jgi:hypothetical protein
MSIPYLGPIGSATLRYHIIVRRGGTELPYTAPVRLFIAGILYGHFLLSTTQAELHRKYSYHGRKSHLPACGVLAAALHFNMRDAG